MATTLGLSLQISANTNGLGQGLEKADKALLSFGRQMNAVGKQAGQFSNEMGDLPKAFGDIESELDLLAQRFKAGAIDQQYFTDRFKALKQAAKDNVAAFKEGAKLNEKYRSSTDKAASEQERLAVLFKKGAISSKTFNAAMKEQAEIISRVKAEQNGSAAALQQFAANEERAAQITQNLATAEERLAVEQAELDRLFNLGVLSQDAYSRGTEQVTAKITAMNPQVAKAGVEFNELTGILSLLPGPLGATFSRISSLSSGLKGLSKTFGGGLKQGLAGIGQSLGGLSAGAVVAGGAFVGAGLAIAGVVKGAVSLEKEVEDISRSARLLGTDFGFLQSLKVSSDRAGRSFSELQEPIARFLSTTQKIRDGDEKLAESFAKVGISIDDVNTKNPDDLLKQLTKNLKEIEDPAKRAAAEIAIFGEQGPKIRDSLGEFEGAAADIEAAAGGFSKFDQDQFKKLDGAFNQLITAGQALLKNVIVPFIPAIVSVSDGLAKWVSGLSIAAKLLGSVIGPIFTFLGTAIGNILRTFGKLYQMVKSVAEYFGYEFSDAVKSVDADVEIDVSLTGADAAKIEIEGFADDMNSAIEKTTDLGQAGFDAAFKYQEQLAEIVELQKEGELSQEEANRAAENITKEFEKQEVAIRAQQEAADELLKTDQDIVASLLEQQRVESEFGGNSERLESFNNILAINREIARVEEEIAAARSSGDTEALEAGNKRLAQLDQIKAGEEDVASGRKDAMEETLKLEKDLAKEQEKLDEMLKSGGPSKERLKAIDATSAAGIEETLRLERGDDPAVEAAEKQLSKLDEIKKAILDAKSQEVLIPS
jgi:hypothetical protein